MTKQLLTLFALAFWTTFNANAQCTPDATLTQYGFSPEQLPPAYSDGTYNQVLTFLVPRDTSIQLGPGTFPVQIDSMRLEKLTGQPAGFTHQCLNRCVVPGGSRGCALLTGSATEAQIGTYDIFTVTKVFYKLNGSPTQANRTDSVKAYTFRIYKTTGVGELISKDAKPTVKVFPNPAHNNLQIDLTYLPAKTSGNIVIIDPLGRVVKQQSFSNNMVNPIEIASYQNGIYKVMVSANEQTYYNSFVKY